MIILNVFRHIKTVMITGDNKNTAYSIGLELGLIEDDDIVLTSDELNKMSDIEIKNIYIKCSYCPIFSN